MGGGRFVWCSGHGIDGGNQCLSVGRRITPFTKTERKTRAATRNKPWYVCAGVDV